MNLMRLGTGVLLAGSLTGCAARPQAPTAPPGPVTEAAGPTAAEARYLATELLRADTLLTRRVGPDSSRVDEAPGAWWVFFPYRTGGKLPGVHVVVDKRTGVVRRAPGK